MIVYVEEQFMGELISAMSVDGWKLLGITHGVELENCMLSRTEWKR